MFSFICLQRKISQLRGPIAAKLCHMLGRFLYLIIQVPKFWGPFPQKSWGPKTCKIWVDFGPLQSSIANISGTDRGIKKSERYMIESDSSRVRRKNSGELWSTNDTALHVDSDPPKSTFSEDHISAPRGRCRLQFLHALQNDNAGWPHVGLCPTFLRCSYYYYYYSSRTRSTWQTHKK